MGLCCLLAICGKRHILYFKRAGSLKIKHAPAAHLALNFSIWVNNHRYILLIFILDFRTDARNKK